MMPHIYSEPVMHVCRQSAEQNMEERNGKYIDQINNYWIDQ
jgi:hypothetical protein